MLYIVMVILGITAGYVYALWEQDGKNGGDNGGNNKGTRGDECMPGTSPLIAHNHPPSGIDNITQQHSDNIVSFMPHQVVAQVSHITPWYTWDDFITCDYCSGYKHCTCIESDVLYYTSLEASHYLQVDLVSHFAS